MWKNQKIQLRFRDQSLKGTPTYAAIRKNNHSTSLRTKHGKENKTYGIKSVRELRKSTPVKSRKRRDPPYEVLDP